MTAADALRRLLADVRAARAWFDQGCHETGCNQPACKCCLECWLHEMTKCPPDVTHGLRDLDAEDLDYLERLALDGLAGEEDRCGCNCPRHLHDMVTGHCTVKDCKC